MDELPDAGRLERWLPDQVVMRIPEGGVRLSELLGTATVDGGGNVLGEVHDLHLREEATDAGSTHVSSSTGSLWAPAP